MMGFSISCHKFSHLKTIRDVRIFWKNKDVSSSNDNGWINESMDLLGLAGSL